MHFPFDISEPSGHWHLPSTIDEPSGHFIGFGFGWLEHLLFLGDEPSGQTHLPFISSEPSGHNGSRPLEGLLLLLSPLSNLSLTLPSMLLRDDVDADPTVPFSSIFFATTT
jgi:hypothetical protein